MRASEFRESSFDIGQPKSETRRDNDKGSASGLARGSPVHQVHWYRTFLVQNIDLPNG